MKEKEKPAKILDFKLMLLWSAWVISLSLICASGSQQWVITHFQTEPEVAAGSFSKLQYSRYFGKSPESKSAVFTTELQDYDGTNLQLLPW